MLYSYLKLVIADALVGSFLDVLFLLLAVILSAFHEKPKKETWEGKKKTELQEKVYRRICVRNITFLIVRPPFYDISCYFLCLLPHPSQVTYFLNCPYKDAQNCHGWYSVWWYHERTVENMKISYNLILARWHL